MSRLPATNTRLLFVVFACVLGVVVGVQLLDPLEPAPTESLGEAPSEDRPAALLNYSIAQLRTTSYTLTVTVADDGDRVPVFYGEMDYPDGEYYYRTGFGEVWTRVYVYPDGAWVKPPEGDWRHQGLVPVDSPRAGEAEARPFRPEYVRPTRTRVHNRTADALWIRVDGNRQHAIVSRGPSETAYTLYELDPETYRVRQSITYNRSSGAVQAVYQFRRYGETEVSRPAGTRNVPVNLLSDLLR
jgi:hypothetical protein